MKGLFITLKVLGTIPRAVQVASRHPWETLYTCSW